MLLSTTKDEYLALSPAESLGQAIQFLAVRTALMTVATPHAGGASWEGKVEFDENNVMHVTITVAGKIDLSEPEVP
jgi:hypothetical protein